MAMAARMDQSSQKPHPFKVFIQRDYSEGTAVKFQVKYPLELEGKLSLQLFEETMNGINNIFADAEKAGVGTYFLGCISCLTAYLIYVCFDTQYDQCMKRLAAYINEQNTSVYIPRGLMIVDPMERGLRVIEISAPS